MCFLTIYKGEKGFVFTHNRDEDTSRQGDIHPLLIQNSFHEYYAPVDVLSGGTWIGFNQNLAAAILNGAKSIHERKQPYKHSRGEIIHQLFKSTSITTFLEDFDPIGLEPFTLLIATASHELLELIWDSHQLHVESKNPDEFHVYSSVTLYNDEVRKARKDHLLSALDSTISADSLWQFHTDFGMDHHTFVNTQYNQQIRTTCIFQIDLGERFVQYADLINPRPFSLHI